MKEISQSLEGPMKRSLIVAASLLFILCFAEVAFTDQLSPAERKIAAVENAIRKNPNKAEPYSDLAMALARRARETSDAAYYARAEEALKKALELSPQNLAVQKVGVWILLGKHEFAQARQQAEILNRRMPDDVQVYGFLTDANIELGNYADAEKAAQWMLDIRPGNLAGLTRGAYLRELMGDLEGSLELMTQAYQETPPAETEDRAWILTQMAHVQLSSGRVDAADKLLKAALVLYPDYHYALENLAQVRTAQKKYVEAVDLLRRRNQSVPQPESLYALAEALERDGQAQDAKAAFLEFEAKARTQMGIADNANRELVFYYADHAHNPEEALRIATMEFSRRHDAFTLDAFAWALYVSGQFAEAQKQMDHALAYGTRNPKFFFHAGAIASKLNQGPKAAGLLNQAVAVDVLADYTPLARKILAALAPMNTASVTQ